HERVHGHVVGGDVAGDVLVGPVHQRVHLDEAPAVDLHHRRGGAGGAVGAAQAGQPGGLAGQRRLEGGDLAGGAAGVGVAAPEVVEGALGGAHHQVGVVAAAHGLDGGQGLGEVVLGVEEDDLDAGLDPGGDVDEHGVGHGGGQAQPVPEA